MNRVRPVGGPAPADQLAARRSRGQLAAAIATASLADLDELLLSVIVSGRLLADLAMVTARRGQLAGEERAAARAAEIARLKVGAA